MMEPKVSIIILNWNKLEYLKQCIKSIEENTDYPNYEVIIFDNGSTEAGTKEFISSPRTIRKSRWSKFLPDDNAVVRGSLNNKFNYKVIMSPANLGFAKGNNEGARIADGELLLFLNNDTIAHKDWLGAMVSLIQQQGCGIVGSKLLYPDGTIQHIGVVFDYRGNRRHIFKKYPSDIPHAMEIRECEAVTGACMLIPKELFEKVGGFDEKYIQGSEDIDLCLKARSLGFKVMFCPQSILTHFEQVSLKEKGNRFKKKTTRHNNSLFMKKWGNKLDKFRLSNDFTGLKPYHYYHQSREEIIKLIPPWAKFILDVGCASGMLGKALKKKNPSLRVWGIEINKEIAKEAEKNSDRVFVTDVEKADTVFDEPVIFDCIIFADVLEHLRDPWSVLKRFHRYLSRNGRIVCSIPNIRHYKIIKEIVRDRWLYRDEGILDVEHLRFFSLATIKNLFAVSGYDIERIERNKKASGIMKFANKLFSNKLDNFLTQQYLIVCKKSNDS